MESNKQSQFKKKTPQKRKKRDVRNKLKMPMFEAVSHDEIILTSFKGEKQNMFNALQDSWEMCQHCGQFFTPQEVADIYANDGFCPSVFCKPRYEKYSSTELPVERINIYAQVLSNERFTESLIYYAFYEIDDMKLAENARLHMQTSEFQNKFENSKVSMELWSSIGLVWVKRGKGGKFHSWKAY